MSTPAPADDTSAWETPPPGRWVIDGLCAQTDPDAFFPEKGGTPRPAKAVCAACPVQRECLDYALQDPLIQGVWGGTTAHERRHIHKERTAA